MKGVRDGLNLKIWRIPRTYRRLLIKSKPPVRHCLVSYPCALFGLDSAVREYGAPLVASAIVFRVVGLGTDLAS